MFVKSIATGRVTVLNREKSDNSQNNQNRPQGVGFFIFYGNVQNEVVIMLESTLLCLFDSP